MVSTAQVMVAGPKLVKRALGHELTKEELGGASVHGLSGVADAVVGSEVEAFRVIRQFLSYMPRAVGQPLPRAAYQGPSSQNLIPALRQIVPADRRKALTRLMTMTTTNYLILLRSIMPRITVTAGDLSQTLLLTTTEFYQLITHPPRPTR